MSSCLWLIGGTTESIAIASAISHIYIPCLVTVTTTTARNIYPLDLNIKIWVGKLDLDQLGAFLHKNEIIGIIDASHPYATVISARAMVAAKEYSLPYLRYERPQVASNADHILELDSFATLLRGEYLQQQRVLLTVGYKTLPQFQPWQQKATLFTRILPRIDSLQVALASGFTADRIIAFRPPINADLEKALWRQWQITTVISKASGKAGGEETKRLVAKELGVKLIIIQRPKLDYLKQTENLAEVVQFCQTIFPPRKS